MNRFLSLAVFAAVLSPAAAQEDAEKVYRRMEAKVKAAKTLRIGFDLVVTDALGKKSTLKGSLILGEDEKCRSEAEGTIFGEAIKMTEVSDGVQTAYLDAVDPKRNMTEKATKLAGKLLRTALPREGFFLSSLNMKSLRDEKPEDVKLSDFKLLGKVKIGARETRSISFKVAIKGKDDPLLTTVWLDTETDLPVRLAVAGGKSDIRGVTETYSEFAIDPKLDGKLFVLPK